MSQPQQITLAVPDVDAASRWLASIVGGPTGAGPVFTFDPGVEVRLTTCREARRTPPSITDLGTLHLCFRVDGINEVVDRINGLPGTEALGDIIETPDGPIQGNKWIYVRSPWGSLFELQEWPDPPAYTRENNARLYHEHPRQRAGALPGIRGLDHAGYSVANLDSSIANLTEKAGAQYVLGTSLTVDEAFTHRQFGIGVACTSTMAMVVASGLNIELFEHGVGKQESPRGIDEIGGHALVLSGTPWASDIADVKAM